MDLTPTSDAASILQARDEEDRRIRYISDEQTAKHIAACPAVRGYNRLMGALLIVSALIGVGGSLAFWSLSNAIKVEVAAGADTLRSEVLSTVRHELRLIMRGSRIAHTDD